MTFGLTLTTAPAEEPVTTTEAKNRLRVSVTNDDTDLAQLIKECRAACEAVTRRQFVTATWTLTLDEFPRWDGVRWGGIRLPRPPLQSVTWVKYYDTDGVQQTLNSTLYHVSTAGEPGRIIPVYSSSWPLTQAGRPDAVEVRFVAGYGSAASQPAEVKAAILELLAYRFDNRGAGDIPAACRRFLDMLSFGEVR